MAESTLSLTFEGLARAIAFRIGYGRKADADEGLSSAQVANVQAAMDAGYRRFLAETDWEFLTPRLEMTLWGPTVEGTAAAALTTTVTATTAVFHSSMIGHTIVFESDNEYTITGYTSPTVVTVDSTAVADSSTDFTITATGVYRLPDDFGGIISDEILFEAGNNDDRVIKITSEPLIIEAWQLDNNPRRPLQGATRRVAGSPGTTGDRWELVVAPKTDDDYVVSFRYQVLADAITAGEYPYGGLHHAETIRKSCLASVEEMFFDHEVVARRDYAIALEQSKRIDRRMKAERLGTGKYRGQQSRRPEYERCVSGGAYGVRY